MKVWEDLKLREDQGTWPVLFISFAKIKPVTMTIARGSLNLLLTNLYNHYAWLLKEDTFTQADRDFFQMVNKNMTDDVAADSLNKLCEWLCRFYRKKVLIFLDEYDTPLQEAYIHGYRDEMTAYIRSLFNSTFKTNPFLERAILTGITRVSRESIFSDLNNLVVVTTTSDKYATAFGFTEEEVFQAMDEQGFTEQDKKEVKTWYDGFTFGSVTDIYNPWSVTNYLDNRKVDAYWANTSGNGLIGMLLRTGEPEMKSLFEDLMHGETVTVPIDEQIIYHQLEENTDAVWSLLLASGYLKVIRRDGSDYELALTNHEVSETFRKMIRQWFGNVKTAYNQFTSALLLNDVDAMNEYMNRISRSVFSSFDTGRDPSDAEPERFYHGFVLGMIVDLEKCYIVRSNRESGFGRYDVMLEPLNREENAYILEFKVFNRRRETSLEDTVQAAHEQIRGKNYSQDLIDRGIPEEHIYSYGFAFDGKEVLIG